MLHFYSLTFLDSRQQGETTHANAYIGLPEAKVTPREIENARRTAEVSGRAVLLSVAYLGHMTREEWDAGQA
ncbi:hypothetical protein D3C76_831430 [compost metagenome]